MLLQILQAFRIRALGGIAMDEPSADGLFKGLLFLGVGSVRHKSGSQRKDGDYHEEKNDGKMKICMFGQSTGRAGNFKAGI